MTTQQAGRSNPPTPSARAMNNSHRNTASEFHDEVASGGSGGRTGTAGGGGDAWNM